MTTTERRVDTSAAFSLVIRRAVYENEEIKQIKAVADSHQYTKHFSFIGYCNRPNFANGNVIVGVIGDTIVSFAAIKAVPLRHETEIDIIGVAEEWRSHGIGAKLIDYIVETMTTPAITLSVQADNEGAINFYLKYGFKRRGTLTAGNTLAYRMRMLCKKGALL